MKLATLRTSPIARYFYNVTPVIRDHSSCIVAEFALGLASHSTVFLMSQLSSHSFVSVSGLGFGFMSGAFSVVNILADSAGPGTVGIHGDSQHYFLSSGNN